LGIGFRIVFGDRLQDLDDEGLHPRATARTDNIPQVWSGFD